MFQMSGLIIKYFLICANDEMRVGDQITTDDISYVLISVYIRGLLEKYPTFGREKETGLLGALDT